MKEELLRRYKANSPTWFPFIFGVPFTAMGIALWVGFLCGEIAFVPCFIVGGLCLLSGYAFGWALLIHYLKGIRIIRNQRYRLVPVVCISCVSRQEYMFSDSTETTEQFTAVFRSDEREYSLSDWGSDKEFVCDTEYRLVFVHTERIIDAVVEKDTDTIIYFHP